MAHTPSVSSREDLIEALEEQILSGKLAPGTRLLSERKLSDTFSVSRSSVREAIGVLAERRLVTVQQGRGTFVTAADPGAASAAVVHALRRENVTARDLIVGRMALEKEAAALAAEARSEDDVRELGSILARLDTSRTIFDEVRLDLAFHAAIFAATHNPVLQTMFSAIAGFTAELMLRSLSDRAVTEVAIPQHRQILEAIEAGDGSRAREVMQAHLAVAMELYGRDLDRSLDAVAGRELDKLLGPGNSFDDLFTQQGRDV
jgi:GntR family transcriptional repressor for pyruvate dehydrogenase complex